MNMIQFHTKMVDSMEEMLQETSELSILWSVLSLVLSSGIIFWMSFKIYLLFLFSFYPHVFEKMFNQSNEEILMKQYLMAFPSVCSHFSHCGHSLCPEEVSVQLYAPSFTSQLLFLHFTVDYDINNKHSVIIGIQNIEICICMITCFVSR